MAKQTRSADQAPAPADIVETAGAETTGVAQMQLTEQAAQQPGAQDGVQSLDTQDSQPSAAADITEIATTTVTEANAAEVAQDGAQSLDAQGSQPPASPPVDPDRIVECAVLYDNIYGRHDDIIELPAEQAAAAAGAGYVDTHPNAIQAIRERD